MEELEAQEAPRGAKDPANAVEEPAQSVETNGAFPAPPEETEDETADETVTPEPVTNGKPARDYTQFDPEVAAILKKLPNGLYEKFSTKLSEWKKAADELPAAQAEIQKLSEGKPRFLSEHPEAYKLTTEYSTALKDYQDASQESSHWQSQLKNIKQGLPWVMLEVNAQGEIVGRNMPAPTDGKTDVDAELAKILENGS